MLGLVARFGCLKMEQCWPWICYISSSLHPQMFFSDRLHDSSASPLLSNRQLCSLLPSKVPESRKVPTSTGSFHQENVLNRWRLKNLDSHGPGYAMDWCMSVGFASVHIITTFILFTFFAGKSTGDCLPVFADGFLAFIPEKICNGLPITYETKRMQRSMFTPRCIFACYLKYEFCGSETRNDSFILQKERRRRLETVGALW